MSTQTDTKSLAFMEKAGQAMGAAEQLALNVNSEKQAALKLAESLADVMIEAKLLEATDHEHFLAKAASHDGSLEVVGNLVKHIGKVKKAYAQKLAVAQGGGAPTEGNEKTAADGSNGRPQNFVGQRAGLGEKRASDDPFLRLAGLPTATT